MMKYEPLEYKPTPAEVGVYDCEIHLRFRLVEEKGVILDREHLLEVLLDAFICGTDDYMEPLQVEVNAEELAELEASPQMRRQLIRLRNSKESAF
jgi:Npun R1517